MTIIGLPYCQVRRAAAQSVPAGVTTALTFDTVDKDDFSMADLGTHPTRVTCTADAVGDGTAAGVYMAWASVLFSGVAESTRRFVAYDINHLGNLFASDSRPGINNAGEISQCSNTGVMRLAVADFVEVYVRHDSLSSPRNVTAIFAIFGPFVP